MTDTPDFLRVLRVVFLDEPLRAMRQRIDLNTIKDAFPDFGDFYDYKKRSLPISWGNSVSVNRPFLHDDERIAVKCRL